MDPIVYAIPVFMLTIVLEGWWARRKKIPTYDLPDAITSLHIGIMSQVLGKFTRVSIYFVIYEKFRITEWSQSSILLWVIALLFYDLCYYWAHRMGHEVGILWAAHVVHHSSEYYNLSTALRQTSSGFLFGWIFYIPMAIAGVPPFMFIVVGLIDLLYQYWVHTELIGRLGWVDFVFVTPSNHRVHHGQNDYCIDKNYGGILIVWDRIFGTFEDEREGEKIIYGVRKPLQSFSPVWANLHFYKDLWMSFLQAKGWRSKLGVFFAPPGGWRDGPIEHLDTSQISRYGTALPSSMRWYSWIQYSVTIPMVSHFLAIFPQMRFSEAVLYAIVILGSNFFIALILERKVGALWLEIARLILLGAACALGESWFGFVFPDWFKVLSVAFVALSAVWLTLQRGVFTPQTLESQTERMEST